MAKFCLQCQILLALLGIVIASGAQQSSSFIHLAENSEEGLDVFKVEFDSDINNEESIGQVLAKQKSQKFEDAESLVRDRRADNKIVTIVPLKNDSNNVAFIFYLGRNTKVSIHSYHFPIQRYIV